jgi:hypothetical protein
MTGSSRLRTQHEMGVAVAVAVENPVLGLLPRDVLLHHHIRLFWQTCGELGARSLPPPGRFRGPNETQRRPLSWARTHPVWGLEATTALVDPRLLAQLARQLWGTRERTDHWLSCVAPSARGYRCLVIGGQCDRSTVFPAGRCHTLKEYSGSPKSFVATRSTCGGTVIASAGGCRLR